MQTVSIFLDVQNIYYTTKQRYQKHFDYNKFWAQATAGRKVVRAHAYAIGRGDEKQKQFQNILRAIGFEIKLKPFIQRSDGSAKGDWDVGLTVDAIKTAPRLDTIVIVSGDGDFIPLVQYLQTMTQVEVMSFGKSTSSKLREIADDFVDMSENPKKYLIGNR